MSDANVAAPEQLVRSSLRELLRVVRQGTDSSPELMATLDEAFAPRKPQLEKYLHGLSSINELHALQRHALPPSLREAVAAEITRREVVARPAPPPADRLPDNEPELAALLTRTTGWQVGRVASRLSEVAPREVAASLVLQRFGQAINNRDEQAACELAAVLVQREAAAAVPGLRRWLEAGGPGGKISLGRDVARFVYGDVKPWAEELAARQDYKSLAAIFSSKDFSQQFQLGARREEAEKALRRAGEAAADAILEELTRHDWLEESLALLLVEARCRRAIPLFREKLESRRFGGGHQREIFRFAYGSEPKEAALLVARSAASLEEKRKQFEALLTAAGLLSSGTQVQHCSCGFPTRLRYADRSEGPALGFLDGVAVEEYTTRYTCPICGSHVQTITS